MKVYETKGTVGTDGTLKLQAPPELANTEVNVLILPKRLPVAERVAA